MTRLSADGKLAMTLAEDKTIREWNVTIQQSQAQESKLFDGIV